MILYTPRPKGAQTVVAAWAFRPRGIPGGLHIDKPMRQGRRALLSIFSRGLKPRSGFSLLEILIVVLLMGLMVQGVYSLFAVGNTTWNYDMGLVHLEQQARQAMTGMIWELRQGNTTSLNIYNGGLSMDFMLRNNPISYYLNNGQIIREYPAGTRRVLASSVSSLNFSDVNGFIVIKINMSKPVLGRNINFSLVERVDVRN